MFASLSGFFFFKPGCMKSPVKSSTLQAIFQIIILVSFKIFRVSGLTKGLGERRF